jgi:hypothetical protein
VAQGLYYLFLVMVGVAAVAAVGFDRRGGVCRW